MGNITLIDSEITASHSGEGHASIIGAGPDFAEGDRDGSDIGTMGDIIITNTDLHLSMAESTIDEYAAMIGTADFSGGYSSYSVNMGKIIFTDITQAQLDEMIATWSIPSDFAEYGGYVLGLGYWTHVYKYNEYEKHCVGTFGGVWVSDGNGGIVQIGNDDGYYVDCKDGSFVHNFDKNCGGTCSDCGVTYYVVHTMGTAATCIAQAVCDTCGESYGELGTHIPNAAGYTVNTDGTHSFECSVCVNTVIEDHSTTADGDRAATCKTLAYCSVCMSEYGEVDTTNHNWVNGVCTYECGITHDPHSFENGICTGCGVIGGYCGEEGNEQNVIWTYANGTLTISGTGAMADQFDNYDNRPWEGYVDQITAIVVNDGITSIGETAFWHFQQLTTAKLPDSLTTISQQAFYGCTALKTVNFPANLKTIEGWAFLGCALESVTLPNGFTTIGYRAFSECKNLTSVTVPASVTTIDEGAFGYSPAKITVAEGNLNYSSDEHGVLFDKNKTTLIYCRPNIEVETYTILSTVTEICKEAFYGCKNLVTIIIPDGVQKIGSSAFGSCEALTTITIPAGVTTIEANTFYGCTALTAVTIPAGVTTIDLWAFSGCTALTTVTIPASVTSIAYNAFSNCSALTTVNVPCTWDGSLYTFDESVTLNEVHNWTNGICTECGESCDHKDSTHTTATNNGDGTHSFECSVCEKTATEVHTLTYSASGNVITATCSANCGHTGTATISASGKTYDDNAVEVVVSKTGSLENTIIPVTLTKDGEAFTGAPVNAGAYTASVTLGDKTVSVNFTIAKADQAAPTGLTKTDTTYFGKADGKISGLTSGMEFRKEGDSTYTAGFNGTLEYLAAGTYYVRYQGDANHNPSPDAVVTVNAGRKLQIVVPQNQVGYTVTVNKTEMEYEGSYTLKVEIHEGYTATEDFKIIISNWECGQQAGVEETYMNAIADQIIEVRGVADITPPAAEIKVKENKWTSFWNNLTFGLFFKETQDVTITVYDAGSGVKSVQYYLSDRELEHDEVRSITDWIDYNGTFKINPDNRYVIYAKVTDNAGNVTYINSEGMVLDATAPVIYGIEDGGIYHGDKVFKAMDENFLKIEVDGVDITDTTEGDDEFKIVADNAEHTVTVTDKAGNVTEYKITVYKKYMVTYTDGEGGSYEKEFKYGEVITIPTNEIFKDTFRKTGHSIKEWQGYTEGMTMPLKDLTFTAVYVPCEYTVSFEQNGGEVINPITVTFGEKYGNLPSSAITGLSGGNKNWYLVDADGNVTETNIKNLTLVSTARDHKLFIKRNVLTPSVSVALTVPGGISDSYQYYIPGGAQRILTANVGNMNTDVLDYTYQWYKDGTLIEGATSNILTLDGNVSDSGTYEVEVTATLKGGTNIVVGSDTATASKEQNVKILHATNTLSYDANGGEGGPQNSYTGGTALNVSKDLPTRAHYDFIGWNTAPDGTGDSYKAEDVYTFMNDNGNGGCEVTLYAQWKLVEYTVTYMADDKPVATEKVEHGKDATLPSVPAKDGYVGKWDSDGKNITGDTTITAVYTAIPVVKPNEVKPEDKTDLEDVKAKLEEELKDDSYTDDDKKDIQEAIDDIDDALEVIGNVEAVEKLIDQLPGTIKKDDEPATKAADDAYNALTDYEKSLVDEDAKKALDDAKAVLAELNKPAEKDSPKTGNNSSLWLWFALLFVSGTGIFGLSLHEYKRRRLIKNN